MWWQPDVSVGEWIDDRLSWSNESMHSVVPSGFEAYARVFHPASVDSLPGVHLPSGDELMRTTPAELEDQLHRMSSSPTTWAETAAAFGTTMHPLAQWQRIVRTPPETDWNQRTAPDGRRFNAPMDGALESAALTTLMGVLADGSTPGNAAIWYGYGGLLGGYGTTGRTFFTIEESTDAATDPEVAWRHEQMLASSVRDPFNNVFQQPTWQEGILSREISEGPRLMLPAREYVVFSGDLALFTQDDWILHVPWRDRPAELHGFAPQAQAPNLVWPDDRSWVMVSEIDFDSTVIGGSRELIDRVLTTPGLETAELPADAALHWEADSINP